MLLCDDCRTLRQELMRTRAELANLEANAMEAIRRLTEERDMLKKTLQRK